MKILIAGLAKLTVNYENALDACRAEHSTDLHPADPLSYDRLLLPGGGDIHPSFFGQADYGSMDVDPELDRIQLRILNAFIRAGKPVLGICRGLQLINVCLGGNIIQDLPSAMAHRYDGQDQIHAVSNVPGSLLHALYGDTCLVNSAHHQGCGRIGKGLVATQVSLDGVAEALEHRTGPILGVQWHPERTGPMSHLPGFADGSQIIRYFAGRL